MTPKKTKRHNMLVNNNYEMNHIHSSKVIRQSFIENCLYRNTEHQFQPNSAVNKTTQTGQNFFQEELRAKTFVSLRNWQLYLRKAPVLKTLKLMLR